MIGVTQLDVEEAEARTVALLGVAKDCVYDAQLRRALVGSTGLSAEGVYLAMTEHLEHSPSRAEIARLLRGRLPLEHEATVLLSANVFIGALRALVVAAVSAERVRVWPSSREGELARALVARMDAPWLQLGEREDVATLGPGALHAYARESTLQQIEGRLPSHVRLYAHGPGFGAAFVEADAPLDPAASALARDIVPFEQRGCLSPRIVMVEGDEARAAGFATALANHLRSWEQRVPHGRLLADEQQALIRYANTWAFAGTVAKGSGFVVVHAPGDAPLALCPPGRAMHVVATASESTFRERLTPWLAALTTLGSWHGTLGAGPLGRARKAVLGGMQRPAFDGPVDLRTRGVFLTDTGVDVARSPEILHDL